MSGLSWLPLISRIVWAKTPQNPRDVAPLNFIFITVFVSVFFFFNTLINLLHFFFGMSHDLPEPRSLRYGLIHFFNGFRSMFPAFIVSGRACMTISRSTLALARSAKNMNGQQ